MTTIRIAAYTTDDLYKSAIENLGKEFEADFFTSFKQNPDESTNIILLDSDLSKATIVGVIANFHEKHYSIALVVLLPNDTEPKEFTEAYFAGATSAIAKGHFSPANFKNVFTHSINKKNLETQLLMRQAQFEGIIESMPDGVVFSNHKDHTIQMVNTAFTKIFGYKSSEVIGKTTEYLFPKDEDYMETLGVVLSIDTGDSMMHQLELVRKGGEKFLAEASIANLMNPEGHPIGYMAIIRDITARVAAEKALAKSERRYRLLAENSSDMITIHDAKGTYLFASPASKKLTGYTPKELLGKDPYELLIHNIDQVETGHEQIVQGKDQQYFVWQCKKKDGTIVWLETTTTSVFNESDELIEMTSVTRDISDRRHVEDSLVKSEQRLRQAQAVAAIGCWEIDLRTDEVWWSSAVYEICGIDPDSGFQPSKESTFDLFILPEYRATLRETGIEAIKKDKPYMLEARIRRQDNKRIRTVELNGSVERDQAGEALAIIGTVQDITERKNLETALQQKASALEISNTELKDFAYAASHDLKEPLRTISVYMGLLTEELGNSCQINEETAEYLEFIDEATSKMNDLIQDLLVYSRVTTRKSQFEEVNVNEVVDEVIKSLRGSIEKSGAQINREDLPTVTTDSTRLEQIFQNLLSNALKFSTETPVITISAMRRNGIWRFSVQDNGIGISEEFLDTIFRPFYRLHGDEEVAGSGIGLAIVKKIIDRWGGRLWVESEPGKGSTFYFTLKETHEP